MKSCFIKQRNLTLTLIVVSLFTFFTYSSCKEDDTSCNGAVTPQPTDSFYVKYVLKGNGAYGRFSNWSVTTDQGKYTNSGTQVGSWTQTYGPVGKGFYCDVRIGNYINGAPTIEIHVAKNQDPFAVKVNKTGNSASYTIN